MPAMILPYRTAPFRLTPSRLALLPGRIIEIRPPEVRLLKVGAVHLDRKQLAALNKRSEAETFNNKTTSMLVLERSARSRRLQERLAPLRWTYLKLMFLRSSLERSAAWRLTPWNLSSVSVL